MDDVAHLSTIESLSNNITNLSLRVVEDVKNEEYDISDNVLCSSSFTSECRCFFYTRLLGRQVEYDRLNIAVNPMLPFEKYFFLNA